MSAIDAIGWAYMLCGLFLAVLNWRHRPEHDRGIDALNASLMHVTFWVSLGPLYSFIDRLRGTR